MSVAKVREYLKRWGKDGAVMEFAESCATVELAAAVAGVSPAQIAKTLSFRASRNAPELSSSGAELAGLASLPCILVLASGDARIDGKKFKERFGLKSKMLSPEEVLACTGHAVGGVCPFAVQNPEAAIYLDLSLRRFPRSFRPAAAATACWSWIARTCSAFPEPGTGWMCAVAGKGRRSARAPDGACLPGRRLGLAGSQAGPASRAFL
ncbi:YbaK/EbsC family protein [Desulfovibrio sp. OttesenSCG-928-A18]|nr:YbaK/EbsC family protein [Desulfovibrio sp. OttesenSCG-928-A18]